MISLFLSINLIIVSSLENNNTLVGVTTKYNTKLCQKSTLEGGIIKIMAQSSSNYSNLKYPEASDPVNVHGDFKVLVDALNDILPPLGMTSVASPVRNASSSLPIFAGTPVFISGSISYEGKMVPVVEKYNPSSSTHNPNVPILGLMQADTLPAGLNGVGNGIVVVSGIIQINTTDIGDPGTKVYVDANGTLVGSRPSSGPARYVGVVAIRGTKPNGGTVIVQTKGNGTWGALKDGLS
jgi:hypothetical protein